ncbi:hypothetical protein GA0074692_6868 [Micromonospora pallida]|uniref:Uncharacterized protein n=1 Tax=Micromonospora pallida TaxID=145854 RepID=A0A1C6TNU5_9ACTN|nr:hypothetical protein [Micromonospora pallida]SCL16351.1 hypothetical protein GA0074692_0009 [Micromonospora pallida]SCL43411.1 hypothetical protein GA0074692_6868 [Micromonospora pallida]
MTWEEFIELHIPEPRTVQVQAYEGSGAYGDVYADPVDVGPCVVDDTTRRVVVQTQDAEGAEGVSSTTVFAPMATVAPPSSLVTLPWTGRTAKVLAVSVMEDHGLGLPEHVELSLE